MEEKMLNSFFIDTQLLTRTTYKDSDTPQVTTWIYNNRGNLSSKKYPNNNGSSYTCNANGNMLTGYRDWVMEWNGDNRLKCIYNGTTKLEFQYDYMGRRISKTVLESGVVQKAYKYVYHGFKLIADYENDVHDVKLLGEAFHMEIPKEYRIYLC